MEVFLLRGHNDCDLPLLRYLYFSSTHSMGGVCVWGGNLYAWLKAVGDILPP